MIRILTTLTLALTLTACGQVDRATAQLVGYSKVCVDGITYLQFTSGATVQVNAQGLPVACR